MWIAVVVEAVVNNEAYSDGIRYNHIRPVHGTSNDMPCVDIPVKKMFLGDKYKELIYEISFCLTGIYLYHSLALAAFVFFPTLSLDNYLVDN